MSAPDRPTCKIYGTRGTRGAFLQFSCAVHWNAITYHINWCVSSQRTPVSHTHHWGFQISLCFNKDGENRGEMKRKWLYLAGSCLPFNWGVGAWSIAELGVDRLHRAYASIDITDRSWNMHRLCVCVQTYPRIYILLPFSDIFRPYITHLRLVVIRLMLNILVLNNNHATFFILLNLQYYQNK